MDSLQTLVQDRLPRSGAPAGTTAGTTPAPALASAASAAHPRLHPRSPLAHDGPRDGSLLHGRYRLRERLGAGGFGVVWRAQDELLHREVALKRIPLAPAVSAPGALERQADAQAGERASREALAAARLAHPAIVALYEAFLDDDAFHLVSELVHGCTLAALIAEDELCDEELLRIGVALAQALAHAHARGVVHRDVKPQNVLIPDAPGPHEAPAKLTDFGGASIVGEDALTRTGETLGTLAYMAPEQSEGLEVDESADIYSLALVLYEGLTGANPVRGPTPAATARRIGRPLPTLAARRPDLPQTLVYALDTALTIDPAGRGSLEDLRCALERSLREGLVPRRGLFAARTARRRALEPGALSPDGTPPAERLPAPGPRGTRTAASRAPWAPRGDECETAVDPRPRARHRLIPRRRADVRDAQPDPSGPDAQPDAQRVSVGGPRAARLPRALWVGCVLALAAWQTASARPGVALLALAGAAPLLLLGPRPGVGWVAAALAPLLGLAGLAGAYPALAGQAAHWARRATLGALGYWWLILAGPLLARRGASVPLWLPMPAGLPARAVWEGSLDGAATHAIAPALSIGVLLGALLWAAGAVVLPWIVRGSSAPADAVLAVLWSAALFAATPYFAAGLSAGAGLAHPRGAVLGAVLGAAVAIAARALRGPVSAAHP